jgi:hypothetical protein
MLDNVKIVEMMRDQLRQFGRTGLGRGANVRGPMITTDNSQRIYVQVAPEKLGYYTRATGQSVYHFYMGDEPPLEQYMLRGDKWVPLDDRWYLMDLVNDGTPDLTGPVKTPRCNATDADA